MERQDLGYDYAKLLEEKLKELEQKLEKANMKDPLEFDSETIFKLEALLANSVAINKELEAQLKTQKWCCDVAEKSLVELHEKLAIAVEALGKALNTYPRSGYGEDYSVIHEVIREALAKIDPDRGPLID